MNPKSYAEIGMPNYPLPLSQDGAHVLTASGVRFASIEPHWDELRLLVRDTDGISAQMKENNLTRGAAMVVKAVNEHETLREALRELVEAQNFGSVLI